jgi:WD40 repeat protein
MSTSGVKFSSVSFSDDGATLAVGLSDGMVELYDFPSRRLRTRFRAHDDGYYHSVSLAFAPDGSTLASCGWGSSPRTVIQGLSRFMTGLSHGGPNWRPPPEVVVIDLTTHQRLGKGSGVIHPYFSPDGRTLAVRDMSLAVRLYDVPRPAAPAGRRGPLP